MPGDIPPDARFSDIFGPFTELPLMAKTQPPKPSHRLEALGLADDATGYQLHLMFWKATALLAAKGLRTPEQVMLGLVIGSSASAPLYRSDVAAVLVEVARVYNEPAPNPPEPDDV